MMKWFADLTGGSNLIWVALIAVPLIFGAGAWWDGGNREDRITRKVLADSSETYRQLAQASVIDAAYFAETARNSDISLLTWFNKFDQVLGASEKERASFRGELSQAKAEVLASRDRTDEQRRVLDALQTRLAKQWKDGLAPADINCGVFHAPGCPEHPKPTATPGGALAEFLPGEGKTAGDSVGRGAAVPGMAGGQPGDSGGPK